MGKIGLFLENVSLDKINEILANVSGKKVVVEIDELTLPGKSNKIEDGSVICGWSSKNNYEIPTGGACNHWSSISEERVVGIPRRIDRIVYIEDMVRKIARFVHIEGRFCCNRCVYTFLVKKLSTVDDKTSINEALLLLKEIEAIENPGGNGLTVTPCIFMLECNGGTFTRVEWLGNTALQITPTDEIYYLPVARKYSKK